MEVIDNAFRPFAETSQYIGVDEEVQGQQQLLAAVSNTNLVLQLKDGGDQDDMTEITSRTDDDPVRDAFQFLNSADDDIGDELQEDEVVYLRYAIFRFSVSSRHKIESRSPTLSPKNHAIVTTPVKALRSPVDLSGQSPTLYQTNKSAAFTFSAPAPQHVPATTAQDLLNDVLGLKNINVNCDNRTPTESTAPQSKFLFGSELSNRPTQSIWSAATDEKPLMYGANGNGGQNGQVSVAYGGHNDGTMASPTQPSNLHADINLHGAGVHQTTFAGRISGSQEPLPPQSIWSYGGHSENYQQPHSPSFAQPLHTNLSPSNHLSPFLRYQSESKAMQSPQLYPNVVRQTLAYTSPVLQQSPIHQPGSQMSSAFSSSSFSRNGLPTMSTSAFGTMTASCVGGGLIESEPGSLVYTCAIPGHQSGQVSIHDPRFIRNQNYMSSSVSQTWGDGG